MTWRSSKLRLIISWFIMISILLPPDIGFAQGKGNGVQVRSVASQSAEVKPGSILSVSFAVTNKTSQDEEYIEGFELPAEWKAINPPAAITLARQKTQARIFAILIPSNAPAGEYDISYSVQSRKNSEIRDLSKVRVNVLPISRLTFLAEEKPDSVIAGDDYQVRVRLLNQGNSESRVLVAVRSTRDSVVQLEPDELTLPAGASQVILAKAKTNKRISRRLKDSLLIEARYADAKDTVAAGLTVSTDIIPKKTGEEDAFRRIPMKITLNTMGDGERSGTQTQFSGAGSLDENARENFEFLVRSSDSQSLSVFGETNQQYLNYHADNVDLRIGDQSYSLSPLTDYYRYGRGLAVDLRQPGGYDFGAFSVQQPWSQLDVKETGVYLRKALGKDLTLKLNALDRRGSDSVAFSDKLWSAEAKVKPARNTDLVLEYGNCNSNRGGSGDDKAYAVRLVGNNRGTYYSLEKTYAGPDYYGYYRDLDYTNGTLSFPLSRQLRGHVLLQKWRQNLGCDNARGSSPEETRQQVGLDYVFASGLSVSLDSDWFHRQDLQVPSTYDYAEHAFQFGVGKSVGSSSIRANVEAGQRNDFLSGFANHIKRYSIAYSLRPSARQYYSIYAKFGDMLEDDTRLFGGNNSVGFCGRWELTDELACTLQYGLYQSAASGLPDVRQIYLTTTYQLPAGNSLALRFRHLGGGYGASAFLLSYEMPWGLPIAKKKDRGTIKGRVYDSEKPGEPGIPRVVVTANGFTTVTDGDGHFVFNSLAAGTYTLAVERNSIGLNRITTVKLPITVDVKSNESSEVEIPVVRSAAVTGKLSISSRGTSSDKPDEEQSNGGSFFIEGGPGSDFVTAGGTRCGRGPKEGDGLPNVLLELCRGTSEVRRVLTNERGEFSFDDLPPGKWKLVAYDYNLPAFYELENGQIDLDLRPGTTDNIALRVVPCIRPVKMIDSEKLCSSKTAINPRNAGVPD